MPNELKKSLFFPGGKILFPDTINGHNGLKFTPNPDGTWTVSLDVLISKDEATDLIRRYSDFKEVEDEADLEASFHNQVYLEAFTDETATAPADIKCKAVELTILKAHKSTDDGQIIIRLIPDKGVGKTQNPATKTQSPATGVQPPHE